MNKSILDKLIEKAQGRYARLMAKVKLLEKEIAKLVEKRYKE